MTLLSGCSAAVECEDSGCVRVVYVAEVRSVRTPVADLRAAADAAHAGAASGAGIAPDAVVLIPPRTLPKTTSGKVRRSGVKQAVLSGALKIVYKRGWDASAPERNASKAACQPTDAPTILAKTPRLVIATVASARDVAASTAVLPLTPLLASKLHGGGGDVSGDAPDECRRLKRQFFDSAGSGESSEASDQGSCLGSMSLDDSAASLESEDDDFVSVSGEEDEGADDWAQTQEPKSESVSEPDATAAAVDLDTTDGVAFVPPSEALASTVQPPPPPPPPPPPQPPFNTLETVQYAVPSLEEVTGLVMAEVMAARAVEEGGIDEHATADDDSIYIPTLALCPDGYVPQRISAPTDISPNDSLSSVGITSQQVVGIASSLGERLDLDIPVTVGLGCRQGPS